MKKIMVLRVECPPVEEFINTYLTPGRPVVITGATKGWPGMKWTIEYLVNRVGNNCVNVRKGTSSEEYKVGKQYKIAKMEFKKFAAALLDNEKSKGGSSFDYYMAVQNIKRVFPEIEAEIPVPPYIGKVHGGPFLWIGCSGHYEFCHYDPDDGMLAIITGKKRVSLFNYNFLKNMYPNPMGSRGRTIQSQVNCDSPDIETFPLFANAICEECIIEPGEMVFIPAFYFHQVSALESTISVNFFFGDGGDCVFLEKVIKTRWEAFSYWLLNIIAQNQETASWKQTLLPQLPIALKCFLLKQYHDVINDKQCDMLVNTILNFCGLDKLPSPSKQVKYPKIKIRGLLFRD